MNSSLRIAPPSHYATAHTLTNSSAPSAPGVHDTLRAKTIPAGTDLTSISSSSAPPHLQSSHPLESRLRNWRATQDNLKSNLLRRTYGIAAPVIRSMELLSVEAGDWDRPSALNVGGSWGCSRVHGDVLRGTDWEVDGWEDVFGTEAEVWGVGTMWGVHEEMENRRGMGW